jgi:hypothetical protein
LVKKDQKAPVVEETPVVEEKVEEPKAEPVAEPTVEAPAPETTEAPAEAAE